jgi:hypothetical protein
MGDIPLTVDQREVSFSHRHAVRFGKSAERLYGGSRELAPHSSREPAIHARCHLSPRHCLTPWSNPPEWTYARSWVADHRPVSSGVLWTYCAECIIPPRSGEKLRSVIDYNIRVYGSSLASSQRASSVWVFAVRAIPFGFDACRFKPRLSASSQVTFVIEAGVSR